MERRIIIVAAAAVVIQRPRAGWPGAEPSVGSKRSWLLSSSSWPRVAARLSWRASLLQWSCCDWSRWWWSERQPASLVVTATDCRAGSARECSTGTAAWRSERRPCGSADKRTLGCSPSKSSAAGAGRSEACGSRCTVDREWWRSYWLLQGYEIIKHYILFLFNILIYLINTLQCWHP